MMTPKPPARRFEEFERDWFLILFGAGMASDAIRKAMAELNRNVMPESYLSMTEAILSGNQDQQKTWLGERCGVLFDEGDKPLRGVFDSIVEHLSFRVMKNGHGSILAAMDKGPAEYLAELVRQAERCRKLLPESQPQQTQREAA
jgi:hypothetical protein